MYSSQVSPSWPIQFILSVSYYYLRHTFDPRKAIMVGDRLDTDIAFGKLGGLATLLVLTGMLYFAVHYSALSDKPCRRHYGRRNLWALIQRDCARLCNKLYWRFTRLNVIQDVGGRRIIPEQMFKWRGYG